MIRAYVVDDEALAVKRLTRMLEATGRVELAGSSIDPEAAVAFLNKHSVDLLFLDIQMPVLTGFELLERLNQEPLAVFTTACDRYALNAFDVNSIDYLLKPVDAERLDRALDKADRMAPPVRAVADTPARADRIPRRRADDHSRRRTHQPFPGERQAHIRRGQWA